MNIYDNNLKNGPRSEEKSERRERSAFSVGAVVSVLLIALFVGTFTIGCASEAQPVKDESELTDTDEHVSPQARIASESDSETYPPIEEQTLQYDYILMFNEEIDEGYQILVNNKVKYNKTAEVRVVSVSDHKNGKLELSSKSHKLQKRTIEALVAMSEGLEDALGYSDLCLNSGYRTVQDQINGYAWSVKNRGPEEAKRYSANPEHSEHHTGLACDLGFMRANKTTYGMGNNDPSRWIWDNCSDYGFILRYPENKESTTMIAYENWHFRYVGFPHAKATEYFGMCFEEYLDMLRSLTLDTKVLYVTPDGTASVRGTYNLPEKDGYIVYFAPMTEGKVTRVKVPRGEAFEDIEISGNNMDGFIVTIALEPTEE